MADAANLKLEIAIAVLNDGRVVFCDLPADLAQVRDVLAGVGAPEIATDSRASEALYAATANGDAPA